MSALVETLYGIQQAQEGKTEVHFVDVLESGNIEGAAEDLSPLAVMPYAVKFYDVDLETRVIDAPEYLSVSKDHKAENVYFRVNRFFDYMDLATTTCVVQYKNKKGTGIYAVPFFDIQPAANGEPEKLIVPWCIDGKASMVDGEITFALRFYRIDLNGHELIYNLNTRPATSKIMYGLDVTDPSLDGDYDIPVHAYDVLVQMIEEVGKKDTYWIEYN